MVSHLTPHVTARYHSCLHLPVIPGTIIAFVNLTVILFPCVWLALDSCSIHGVGGGVLQGCTTESPIFLALKTWCLVGFSSVMGEENEFTHNKAPDPINSRPASYHSGNRPHLLPDQRGRCGLCLKERPPDNQVFWSLLRAWKQWFSCRDCGNS